MTDLSFRRAEKRQAKLRLAFDGPSGSGKTWTALITARALAGPTGRVAVIDTERGSASLYADRHEFDVLELHGSYDPARYIQAIRAAERAGYDVIVIDSLSHAWDAEGGVLDIVERNKKGGNKWAGWASGTPAYRSLVDAMLQSPCHIIVTMRTKVEWVQDEKGKPQKVGTSPVMREGMDYEMTVVCDLDLEHHMIVTKTRCPAIADRSFRHPGEEFGLELLAWLESGEAQPAPVWQTRFDEAAALVGAERAEALLNGADPRILETDKAWERFQTVIAADTTPTPTDHEPQGTLQTEVPVVTEAQRRQFFAVANEHGVDEDAQKRIVLEVAGVTSQADIPAERFDSVLDALRNHLQDGAES